MTVARSWEVAEIGRFLHTHRLDAGLAAGGLDLGVEQAEALKRDVDDAFTVCPARAALLLNILVRLEVRCSHDGAALRAALERPAEPLASDSIAARLRGQVDLAGLRLLREAAGTLPVAKVKMWRTPDRYS